MRQIAYPAAIGCGCLLGSDPGSLCAAEWSITPTYSSSVDYDSNRRLVADSKDSTAEVLTADVRFKRALENSEVSLEPRYTFRRYTDSTLGNGDDRSLYAALTHLGERMTLNLTASVWDQSTLITELLETGITTGNTHRRLAQTGGMLSFAQTERRQLIAQLSYSDTHYYGGSRALLPGYRYSSGSVGERFIFSEKGSFTLSAYGSALSSDTAGNSSHEYGIQAQIIYTLTELTRVDASLGESARVLAGNSSHGTDAAVSLTHDFSRGSLAFNYTRSLIPYGTGFLAERQLFSASVTRPLNTFLDANLTVLRADNNEIAVLLGLDRRRYDTLAAGLNWHPAETWTLGGQVGAARTQAPGLFGQTVHEWRGAVTLTWSPLPRARSW